MSGKVETRRIRLLFPLTKEADYLWHRSSAHFVPDSTKFCFVGYNGILEGCYFVVGPVPVFI
jgi:hypothetical protein